MNVTAAGKELCHSCSIYLASHGGGWVYVRKSTVLDPAYVLKLRKKGFTISAIAKKCNKSQRQIMRILKKAKK